MSELEAQITSVQESISENNRVQSASSIKTLKQCPRKYYYRYVEEIQEETNIYAIRGKAAHRALEEFFSLNTEQLETISKQTNRVSTLKAVIRNQFDDAWKELSQEIETIDLNQALIKQYHDETISMLMDYVEETANQITGGFVEGFEAQKPIRIEEEIISEDLGVRGFIDVQRKDGDDLIVLDYKTSSRMGLEEHLLQLGIYALLIKDKHGKIPEKVGVIFLKHAGKTQTINVTQEMLRGVINEIRAAHKKTQSREKSDYNKIYGPLCKWNYGQCGYFDVCQKDK
ncbi:PD-(D/E)XK nuclease family protein [Candidatus Woesearchaeota archaeon]|nr:PD-(D/E)XK nuclease family protein [Candidatus Woesearchaeota archaeon]